MKIKVKLLKDHRDYDHPYVAGEVLEVDEPTCAWLVENGVAVRITKAPTKTSEKDD